MKFGFSILSFFLTVFILFFIFNVYLFIERERERERENEWGRSRERETQNPKQAPGSELSAEPDMGLKLTNCEIMT